jgi:hypothetical protein
LVINDYAVRPEYAILTVRFFQLKHRAEGNSIPDNRNFSGEARFDKVKSDEAVILALKIVHAIYYC